MMQLARNMIVLLLMLTYGMSVSGFSIKAHYCHGKLVSIKINSADLKCCCSKKKVPAKCCDTKKVEVKAAEAHIKTSAEYSAKNLAENFALAPYTATTSKSVFADYFKNKFPDFRAQVPLPDIYLFIRVFRI